MNLIEKLGLENAKVLNGMLQKHAVPESWRIAVINGMWQRSSVGFTHGELRTAIANHDLTVSNLSQNDKQIDLSIKKDIEDHCTDIGYHLSPLTGVIEG